jgi:hypothetical protein
MTSEIPGNVEDLRLAAEIVVGCDQALAAMYEGDITRATELLELLREGIVPFFRIVIVAYADNFAIRTAQDPDVVANDMRTEKMLALAYEGSEEAVLRAAGAIATKLPFGATKAAEQLGERQP